MSKTEWLTPRIPISTKICSIIIWMYGITGVSNICLKRFESHHQSTRNVMEIWVNIYLILTNLWFSIVQRYIPPPPDQNIFVQIWYWATLLIHKQNKPCKQWSKRVWMDQLQWFDHLTYGTSGGQFQNLATSYLKCKWMTQSYGGLKVWTCNFWQSSIRIKFKLVCCGSSRWLYPEKWFHP